VIGRAGPQSGKQKRRGSSKNAGGGEGQPDTQERCREREPHSQGKKKPTLGPTVGETRGRPGVVTGGVQMGKGHSCVNARGRRLSEKQREECKDKEEEIRLGGRRPLCNEKERGGGVHQREGCGEKGGKTGRKDDTTNKRRSNI